MFFSRVSNGSVRFLIKSKDALLKFSDLKSFKNASNVLKERKLRPYRFMDQMELELRNLEVVDTSDNLSSRMKIKRRDTKIEKDFFSAAEYAIFGVNNYLELDYYKKNRKRKRSPKDYVFYN
jgi:hypothetical protein